MRDCRSCTPVSAPGEDFCTECMIACSGTPSCPVLSSVLTNTILLGRQTCTLCSWKCATVLILPVRGEPSGYAISSVRCVLAHPFSKNLEWGFYEGVLTMKSYRSINGFVDFPVSIRMKIFEKDCSYWWKRCLLGCGSFWKSFSSSPCVLPSHQY